MPSGGMRTKPGGKCIAHHRTRPQPQISLSHPHSAYNFFIATASAAPAGVGPAQVHPSGGPATVDPARTQRRPGFRCPPAPFFDNEILPSERANSS